MSFHSLLAGREGALEGGEPDAPGEDYLIPGGEEPGIPGKDTLEIHPTGSSPSAPPAAVGMVHDNRDMQENKGKVVTPSAFCVKHGTRPPD